MILITAVSAQSQDFHLNEKQILESSYIKISQILEIKIPKISKNPVGKISGSVKILDPCPIPFF